MPDLPHPIIRHAETEDRAALVRLMIALQEFERAIEASLQPGAEMAEAHIDYQLREVAARKGVALLAEQDRRPRGFLIGWMEEEPGSYVQPDRHHYGFINSLFVDEDMRGSGLAQHLIAAAEAHFAVQGAGATKLFALAKNPLAQRFYERVGYRPIEWTYFKRL